MNEKDSPTKDEKLHADMSQQHAFNMVSRSKATPSSKTRLDHLIEGIIRDVCELPDYNSPDDQPELLQATCSQLEAILRNRLGDETSVRRCGWFGEGRGQCLLKEGHETHLQTKHHTCEQDGRLLDVARTVKNR